MSLRMNKTERAYADARAAGTLVPLSQEPRIIDAPNFEYWKVVNNRFPHDRHHERHVLVVLKRDCPVEDVADEELIELWRDIFPWANDHFGYVKFNLRSQRSVHATPHLHLMTLKEEYR